MSATKPDANAASIEAARAARRELHEEIQAARDAQRQLRAELAGFDTLAAAAAARAQEALDACEQRVNTEIEGMALHISAENAKVLEAIARYLGNESPAHLLAEIVDSLCKVVMPLLSEQLTKDMPEVLYECLQDMLTEGGKRAARVSVIQKDGPMWRETPFYVQNGAVGSVPLPPVP